MYLLLFSGQQKRLEEKSHPSPDKSVALEVRHREVLTATPAKKEKRSRADRNKSDPNSYHRKVRYSDAINGKPPTPSPRQDSMRKSTFYRSNSSPERNIPTRLRNGRSTYSSLERNPHFFEKLKSSEVNSDSENVNGENDTSANKGGTATVIHLVPKVEKRSSEKTLPRRSESYKTAVLNQKLDTPPPVPDHSSRVSPRSLQNQNNNNQQRPHSVCSSDYYTGKHSQSNEPDGFRVYDNIPANARCFIHPAISKIWSEQVDDRRHCYDDEHIYDEIYEESAEMHQLPRKLVPDRWSGLAEVKMREDNAEHGNENSSAGADIQNHHLHAVIMSKTNVSLDYKAREGKPFLRRSNTTALPSNEYRLQTRCGSLPNNLNRLSNPAVLSRSHSECRRGLDNKTSEEILKDLEDFMQHTSIPKMPQNKFPVSDRDIDLLDAVPIAPSSIKEENHYELIDFDDVETYHHPGMIGSIKHILDNIGNKVRGGREGKEQSENIEGRVVFTLAKAYSETRWPIGRPPSIKNDTSVDKKNESVKTDTVSARHSKPIELCSTISRHRPPRPKKQRHHSEPPFQNTAVTGVRMSSTSNGSVPDDENYGSMSEGRLSNEMASFYVFSDSDDSENEAAFINDQCSFEQTFEQNLENSVLRDSAIYSDQEQDDEGDDEPVFTYDVHPSINDIVSLRGRTIRETVQNIENRLSAKAIPEKKPGCGKNDTINDLLKEWQEQARLHKSSPESLRRRSEPPVGSLVATKQKELHEHSLYKTNPPSDIRFVREMSPSLIEKLDRLQSCVNSSQTGKVSHTPAPAVSRVIANFGSITVPSECKPQSLQEKLELLAESINLHKDVSFLIAQRNFKGCQQKPEPLETLNKPSAVQCRQNTCESEKFVLNEPQNVKSNVREESQAVEHKETSLQKNPHSSQNVDACRNQKISLSLPLRVSNYPKDSSTQVLKTNDTQFYLHGNKITHKDRPVSAGGLKLQPRSAISCNSLNNHKTGCNSQIRASASGSLGNKSPQPRVQDRLRLLHQQAGIAVRRRSWELEENFLDGLFIVEPKIRVASPGWVRKVVSQLQTHD